jgi:alpha-beta hydrolase superfamily lysophospholipase
MKILFLHGYRSGPTSQKAKHLKDNGHKVFIPQLPDEDFPESVRTAQESFDVHSPDVVVGSSRGGAVAMDINAGATRVVLVCPAWRRFGSSRKVKPGTLILHSRRDDVVPFADSEELIRNSNLPQQALIEVGTDHGLADPESLAVLLRVCERGH